MIRYRIDLPVLRNRINQEKSTWLTRADAARNYFDVAGHYAEPPKDPGAPTPFWSEVKWVYLNLQRRKCAYCERCPSSWAGDFAIEHFRPKSTVDDWPSAKYPNLSAFAFASSGTDSPGYHLLAYHPLNYAAACNQCNTKLKRCYFPIAGNRDLHNPDPIVLCSSEKPYLIYPLGNHDANPEDLIGFNGIVPVAKAPPGSHDQRRADITIEIFALQAREDLRRERSVIISGLIDNLEDEHNHPDRARRVKARKAIRRAQSRGSQHSSCTKCFIALYRLDPDRARQLAKDATKFLDKTLRKGFPRS